MVVCAYARSILAESPGCVIPVYTGVMSGEQVRLEHCVCTGPLCLCPGREDTAGYYRESTRESSAVP